MPIPHRLCKFLTAQSLEMGNFFGWVQEKHGMSSCSNFCTCDLIDIKSFLLLFTTDRQQKLNLPSMQFQSHHPVSHSGTFSLRFFSSNVHLNPFEQNPNHSIVMYAQSYPVKIIIKFHVFTNNVSLPLIL